MRRITNQTTINIDNLDLPILTNDGKYSCYIEPLEKIKRELDSMLSHHRKVFVFRLDMRIHSYSPDNKVITKFIISFRDWLKRKYKLKRVGYVWCREVETAKQQHYHLMFMVDGTKVKTMKNISNKAIEIALIQDLSAWIPEKPSYLIERKKLSQGDYSKYNAAFLRASYLAKERGKKIKGERANSFQTSRIKPKLNVESGDDYNNKKELEPC